MQEKKKTIKDDATKDDKTIKDDKWDFSDYAFMVTGIIVLVLLFVPDLLEFLFGIRFLGGSMNNIA
jgi:uncharacterized protein YdaL